MNTITITRKQFREAVTRCNEEFAHLASEVDGEDETGEGAFTTLLMMTQNSAFAAAIEYMLFHEMKMEDK